MSFLLPPINIPSPAPRDPNPEVKPSGIDIDLSPYMPWNTDQDSNSSDSDSSSSDAYNGTENNLTDEPSSADSDSPYTQFQPDEFSNDKKDPVDWLNNQIKLWYEAFEKEQASADKAMEFEAAQAELNRQFQKEMSDTAYQRAVEDMKKAGINPLLAFGTLNGASTPSGATASGHSANYSASNLSSYYNTVMGWYNNNTQGAVKLLAAIAQFLGNILG